MKTGCPERLVDFAGRTVVIVSILGDERFKGT